MTSEGPANGDAQHFQQKRKDASGVPDKRGEFRTREGSCFPVNMQLSSRVVARMTAGEGLDAVREANINSIAETMRTENPALEFMMISAIRNMRQELGHTEEFVTDYVLGLTTAYSILHEQAAENNTQIPRVPLHTVDAYKADVAEKYQLLETWEEIENHFTASVEDIASADPGFIEPLRDHAPDFAINSRQKNFMAAAVDVYNIIQKTEEVEKMKKEFGLEEPE